MCRARRWPSAAALERELSGADARPQVDAVLARFGDAASPQLPADADIDRCFRPDAVADIVAALERRPGEWARAAARALLQEVAASMTITLEQLERARNLSFEDCMAMEYRLAQALHGRDHDFFEGVRAVLIDKDSKPKWSPATLEGRDARAWSRRTSSRAAST